MADWRVSLRAVVYLARHLVSRSLRHPAWAWRAGLRVRALARAHGYLGVRTFLLDDYLPRHYRAKTKIHVREPSSSFYRRFAGLVSPPSARAAHGHRLPQGDVREPPSILVIRRGVLGDVLMATPIVRKLYQARDGFCRIDVATEHGDVFRNNPYVRRTMLMRDLADMVRPVDLIIDLDGVYERNPALHPTHAYAFHVFGRIEPDLGIDLFPDAADIGRIERVVQSIGRPYLVVHKAARRSPQRNLPMELWDKVITGLLERTNMSIVQIGTADDQVLAGTSRLLDHRGHYSVQELHQLIEWSAFFVGGDSGPAHIASASRAPMAVFYTSAHHEYRKPLRPRGTFVPITPDIECYGCQAVNPLPGAHRHCSRHDYACVWRFDADAVLQQILRVLANEAPGNRAPA